MGTTVQTGLKEAGVGTATKSAPFSSQVSLKDRTHDATLRAIGWTHGAIVA